MVKAEVGVAPGERPARVSDLLRVPRGPVRLDDYDPRATPGFGGGKKDGKAAVADYGPRLADLQEMLWAEGRSGGRRSVLLVLQGMDTSGKGGTVRHVVGLVQPMGVRYRAFGVPTEEERAHDFLWRIGKALPGPGVLGVFDRSHYEDVLVVRVHELVPRETWEPRFDRINDFEQELVERGTAVVKCFLHISPDEQRARLLARLDRPDKHWKYNPGDVDERARWGDYEQAYADVLERCNSDVAPWHVVPADRKWYRNWAVTMILLETFESLGLRWPLADFDVERERRRVASS
jgi:PPK2 family polyphosphate:nucleotide phosphotransferase